MAMACARGAGFQGCAEDRWLVVGIPVIIPTSLFSGRPGTLVTCRAGSPEEIEKAGYNRPESNPYRQT